MTIPDVKQDAKNLKWRCYRNGAGPKRQNVLRTGTHWRRTKSSDSTCPPIRLAKFLESFTSVEPAILFLTNVSGPATVTSPYTTYTSAEANSLIESSSLNVVQVHDWMHLNIACLILGMRRTNHVTYVQKNRYLKTNPHQKLRLKHYRNWMRWILDDRDKT